MASQIRCIVASSIDGRAHNPYYAQTELKHLYEALVSSQSNIKSALRHDSKYLAAEIETEYYLTLSCVRECYASIDADKALEEEYSIARQIDHPFRVVPVGSVYVVPSKHSVLYSIIAPLSAAIAAGNCVVVELQQTISELFTVLRQLLTQALNVDTFAVVDSKPDDAEFFSACTIVQDETGETSPQSNQVTSRPTARVVTVVDRSSNVKEAARDIVRARFAFGGRSPYAPDLVLVNEFAVKDFCNAAIQQATAYFGEQIDVITNGSIQKTSLKAEGGVSQRDLSEAEAETLVSASRGKVVLVRKRKSPLLERKICEALIIVHPVSSLDDAIDLTNSRGGSSLLATHVFAAPDAAKYVSQFIDARLTCVNNIPVDLLVGPACPSNYTPSIDAHSRFTKSMFTQPHPEYIKFPTHSNLLERLLDSGAESTDAKSAWREVREEVKKPLPEKKRAAEHQNVGFFEQGLLTGASILVTSAITTGVVVGIWGVSALLRRRM